MTDFKAGSGSQFEGGAPSLQGSTRSEGTLPSKPNPGFPIEGGAPSLRGNSFGARAPCPRLEAHPE